MLSKNDKQIRPIAFIYLIVFVVSTVWDLGHGMLLSQWQPVLLHNRLDFTLQFILLTGAGKEVIQSQSFRIILDVINILLPFALTFSVIRRRRIQPALAMLTSFFALFYFMLICATAHYSMETYIAFVLLPLLFLYRKTVHFFLVFNCLRIIFILFFFSSGLYKVLFGALFNTEQFSAILIQQHSSMLTGIGTSAYKSFIEFWVHNPMASWFIYVGATFIELSFLVGLITKKFDRFLGIFLCCFLLFDYVFMGITYIPWFAFTALFFYSKSVNLSGQKICY